MGDVDVAFSVVGAGDPLVLLHGATSSGERSWQFQVPGLAKHCQVILPDFPGSGATHDRDPSRPLTVDELAGHTLGVVDALGLQRFHVAGWSLGAVVAAEVAASAPNRVVSAALVCGWARTDARMRFTFDLWARLIEADPELFMRYVLADGLTSGGFEALSDAAIELLVPQVAAELARGSLRQIDLDRRVDIVDRLHLITCPTLVVGAVEDRLIDVRHSHHLADLIARSTLVEVDCGHLLPTERADTLTQLLLDHVGASR